MKAITHAQKQLLLEYFEVLEAQLQSALASTQARETNDSAFVNAVAGRVHERIAGIAARLPDVSAPSLQQVRKNLETVLDPGFFGAGNAQPDARFNPIAAVRTLREQLGYQKVYTPPEGGKWTPRGAPRSATPPGKARRAKR